MENRVARLDIGLQRTNDEGLGELEPIIYIQEADRTVKFGILRIYTGCEQYKLEPEQYTVLMKRKSAIGSFVRQP